MVTLENDRYKIYRLPMEDTTASRGNVGRRSPDNRELSLAIVGARRTENRSSRATRSRRSLEVRASPCTSRILSDMVYMNLYESFVNPFDRTISAIIRNSEMPCASALRTIWASVFRIRLSFKLNGAEVEERKKKKKEKRGRTDSLGLQWRGRISLSNP